MSNARNLSNFRPSTSGQVETADIADAAVTSDKLASGAAASNLGNYVTTVNGSTGAVTVATSAQGSLADSALQPGDNISDLTNNSGYLTSLSTTNWTITESGGVLYFAYSGTNKAKLDSSGNLTVVGNVTAYGTV